MSSFFTVRVELHSSNYVSDFEKLHNAMGKEGFTRLIKDGTGKYYHLPRAEYSIYSEDSRPMILEKAKNAVASTSKTAEILVTESSGRTWDGLTEAK